MAAATNCASNLSLGSFKKRMMNKPMSVTKRKLCFLFVSFAMSSLFVCVNYACLLYLIWRIKSIIKYKIIMKLNKNCNCLFKVTINVIPQPRNISQKMALYIFSELVNDMFSVICFLEKVKGAPLKILMPTSNTNPILCKR